LEVGFPGPPEIATGLFWEEALVNFVIGKDVEAGVGVGETFQIINISIEDRKGNSVEITPIVKQSKHFQSDDDLNTSPIVDIPVKNVRLTEV
jgi:hypothetical protein